MSKTVIIHITSDSEETNAIVRNLYHFILKETPGSIMHFCDDLPISALLHGRIDLSGNQRLIIRFPDSYGDRK